MPYLRDASQCLPGGDVDGCFHVPVAPGFGFFEVPENGLCLSKRREATNLPTSVDSIYFVIRGQNMNNQREACEYEYNNMSINSKSGVRRKYDYQVNNRVYNGRQTRHKR